MPSPESRGIPRNLVEISKKADILTGIVGVIIGSAPVVAFAVVSYYAGNEIGKHMDKKEA